jgi:hypothetical protein
VLNILPLAGVKQEVDARIVELRPTGERSGTPSPALRAASPSA